MRSLVARFATGRRTAGEFPRARGHCQFLSPSSSFLGSSSSSFPSSPSEWPVLFYFWRGPGFKATVVRDSRFWQPRCPLSRLVLPPLPSPPAPLIRVGSVCAERLLLWIAVRSRKNVGLLSLRGSARSLGSEILTSSSGQYAIHAAAVSQGPGQMCHPGRFRNCRHEEPWAAFCAVEKTKKKQCFQTSACTRSVVGLARTSPAGCET